MNWFLLIVLILFFMILSFYFDKLKTNKKNIENKLSGFFEKKEKFFTNSEKVFWDLLEKLNQDKYLILSKVRLEDIVKVGKDISWEQKQVKRNYIKSKHLDFVILDKKTSEILSVIELDGKSHDRKKQGKYDFIKNEILDLVKIKLFRIKVGENFEDKIKDILFEIEEKKTNSTN